MVNFLVLVLALAAPAPANDIETTLTVQAEAWNRGDLPAFVSTYSEETVFVGKQLTRGIKGVLERYQKSYPTRAAMGTLTYSDLEVKMLSDEYASVIGRFHLARTAEGGGDARGIFTLLMRKTPAGWKIILDHTS